MSVDATVNNGAQATVDTKKRKFKVTKAAVACSSSIIEVLKDGDHQLGDF